MATSDDRQVILGQDVILEIAVRNAAGALVDADSLPEVAILDADGNILRERSSTNVLRFDTGKYRITYSVPVNGVTGIYYDRWYATVSGLPTEAGLNFVVLSTGGSIDASGPSIGDDPSITTSYTSCEIEGINILLAKLKARLKNNLSVETTDAYGNMEFTDCSIFSNDELVWFLECSLSEFNATPHFSDLTFCEEIIYSRFSHDIVEGAAILAYAAQLVTEAGREWTVSDNGITFNPPQLSNALNNELSQFVASHRERLKYIKTSMKPRPRGFGGFRVLGSSPSYLKLRHLRQRRII